MRGFLGIVVLLVGLASLGLWARAHQAPAIQEAISLAAEEVIAPSIHGAQVRVSGRDITVSGLADTEQERGALVAALNAIPGRRVVNDDLSVLPVADPFVLSLTKEAGRADLAASGNIPTEAARADLSMLIGPGADNLTLASGAPANWADIARAAIAALGPLDFGRAELTNEHLRLVGQARTPTEAGRARAALATLPEGTATEELSLLDDGTPPIWTLDYTAAGGARLTGKLPVGLEPAAIAAALGLEGVEASVRQAMIGAKGGTGPLAALAPWLAELETLQVTMSPDGAEVVAGVGAGTDVDLTGDAIAADLAAAGGKVSFRLEQVAPDGADGSHRTNAATGQEEMLSGGFWLPIARITPSVGVCTDAANAILSSDPIGFLSGSDRLDAHARRVINRLAAVALPCARDGGLRALLGGHTDATGDALLNLGLSQRRATTVRLALIARGIPGTALRAQGYGDQRPIAPNDTDEGKAANRRTTIEWSE